MRSADRLGCVTVDWWAVHTYVLPILTEVGDWPMAGTAAWQHLPDGHPAKLAALFDAARHHVLRVDTAQAALAEAARDISAAADWRAVARNHLSCNEIYIPRRIGSYV
jgi:hypothetical protein